MDKGVKSKADNELKSYVISKVENTVAKCNSHYKQTLHMANSIACNKLDNVLLISLV